MDEDAVSGRRRLFLALWPDPGLQRELYCRARSLAADSRGRPVSAANIHLTLAFVGAVDESQQACLEALLDRIDAPSQPLTLDRLLYWRRSGVLCFTASEPPEGLMQLQAAIREGVEACGMSLDPRPFHPHVTLLRKARRLPRDAVVTPVRWEATVVALVASITHSAGVEYRVLRQRRLQG